MELSSPNNTKFKSVNEWLISEVDSKLNSLLDFLPKSSVATDINTFTQINKSDTNKAPDLVKSKKRKRKLSERKKKSKKSSEAKKYKSEKDVEEINSNSFVIPEMGTNKKKKVQNKDNIDSSNLIEEPSQETQIEENVNKFKSPISREKSKKMKNKEETEDPSLQYLKKLFKEHSHKRFKLFGETIEKTEIKENMPNHMLPGSNEKSKKKHRDLKPQVEENAIFKSPSPKETLNGEEDPLNLNYNEENVPGSNEKLKKKNGDNKQDKDSLEYIRVKSPTHQIYFETLDLLITPDLFDDNQGWQVFSDPDARVNIRESQILNNDTSIDNKHTGKAKFKEGDNTSDTSIDDTPVRKVKSKKNKRKSKEKKNSSLSVLEEDITCDNLTNISEEHKKYKTLVIKLPSGYKVPPLHRMKMASKCTEEELKLAKSLNAKFGAFSKEEDAVIIKNWKSLCKSHELPENPTIFPKLSNLDNKEERKKILQFLSQGLEKRLPLRVYERLKKMYDKVQKKQGRFTKLEDEKIIEFMLKTTSKKHNHECGILLNRSAASIEKRYFRLMTPKNKTPTKWDRQMSKKLIRGMLQVAETDNVKVLKSMEFRKSQWSAVSYLLGGIPVKKIERVWKLFIYPILFSRK